MAEYQGETPFVVCASNGGTLDDDAFAAGWEAGRLDLRLGLAGALSLGAPTEVIRRLLLPQVELIAMRHDLTVHEVEMSFPPDTDPEHAARARSEWAAIRFTHAAPLPDTTADLEDTD